MRIKQASTMLIFLALVGVIAKSFSFQRTILSPSSLRSLSMVNTHPKQISEGWAKGFQDCQEELCQVIGENLPIDLRGTLYRNHMGKFTIGKENILHPFDADGMISAITIANGKALFRNRFVRTKGFLRERKAKKILYRGAFGTKKAGGWLANLFSLNLKNIANTNVLYWGGRLLAEWEGGLPYRLEGGDLRTLGEYRLKGLLQIGQPFSAHHKIDPRMKRMINFSAQQKGPGATSMTVYEIDENMNVAKQRTFPINGFGLFHDFAITENYYLFTRCPLTFQPLPFLLGVKGPADCISFNPQESAEIYIVPRDADKPVEMVKVDPHFNFHYANAFEDAEGNINLDVVWSDRMVLGETQHSDVPVWQRIDYTNEVPLTTLVRYELYRTEGGQQWSYRKNQLSTTYLEFPIVHPDRVGVEARYVYAGTGRFGSECSSPVQGVLKLDTKTKAEETWLAEEDEFVSEAAFAPRVGSQTREEDDGYILLLVTKPSTKTTDFVILDAKNLSSGPVQRLPVPTYLPHGLHGMFAENATFDFDEVQSRFKAYGAVDGKWNEMDGGFSGLGLKYEIM
eukprot:gene849-924_t